MRKITVVFFALAATFSAFPATAAQHDAVVTETVNQVTHGSSQTADSTPAHPGTLLQDGEYLKTGGESLAEMKLPNQTVTRLGSNTIFNYSASNNQVDLQAGTVLFSKPKDGQQLNIKTEAVTAAIMGTTGFLQVHHGGYVFGLIEGKAGLIVNGTTFVVHGGELLMFKPGSAPQIIAFNVPLMLRTSPLFTKFGHNLPNESYIAEEVALYNSLLARGFIKPEGGSHFNFDYLQGTNFPSLTFDSSSNNRNQGPNPPPPTPATPATPTTTPGNECDHHNPPPPCFDHDRDHHFENDRHGPDDHDNRFNNWDHFDRGHQPGPV